MQSFIVVGDSELFGAWDLNFNDLQEVPVMARGTTTKVTKRIVSVERSSQIQDVHERMHSY